MEKAHKIEGIAKKIAKVAAIVGATAALVGTLSLSKPANATNKTGSNPDVDPKNPKTERTTTNSSYDSTGIPIDTTAVSEDDLDWGEDLVSSGGVTLADLEAEEKEYQQEKQKGKQLDNTIALKDKENQQKLNTIAQQEKEKAELDAKIKKIRGRKRELNLFLFSEKARKSTKCHIISRYSQKCVRPSSRSFFNKVFRTPLHFQHTSSIIISQKPTQTWGWKHTSGDPNPFRFTVAESQETKRHLKAKLGFPTLG